MKFLYSNPLFLILFLCITFLNNIQAVEYEKLQQNSSKELSGLELKHNLNLSMLNSGLLSSNSEGSAELKELIVLRPSTVPLDFYYTSSVLENKPNVDKFIVKKELPNYIFSRKYSLFNIWNVFFDSEIMPENVTFFIESDIVPLSMQSAFNSLLYQRATRIKEEVELRFEVRL